MTSPPLFDWFGGGRGAPMADAMTAENFRILFRTALRDETAAARHHERIAARVAELRDMGMARSDFRRVMGEADASANPAPRPERVTEPTVRVRVIEGFSHEWDGIPYAAPTGSVIDIPRGFAHAAAHLFSEVPETTPLHCVWPAGMPR